MNQKEISALNLKEQERAKEEYNTFLNNFNKGKCYICNNNLDYFEDSKPCLHWLLSPPGIKKKCFKELFKMFDLFQINSYLMWVAYQQNGAANINNLAVERDKNKLWEVTITYKNLKWSITCSKTDFTGHDGSRVKFPHYHFLMEVNGNKFIAFSDFHIPLTEEDMLKMKAHNNSSGRVGHYWYVPGMEEICSLGAEDLLKNLKTTEDPNKSTFSVGGVFEKEGGIPEEELNRAIMKSRETGDCLANCLGEIPGIKSTVIIEPGEAVPELDKKLSRSQRRKKSETK